MHSLAPQPLGKLLEIKPSIYNTTGPQPSKGKPPHARPPSESTPFPKPRAVLSALSVPAEPQTRAEIPIGAHSGGRITAPDARV